MDLEELLRWAAACDASGDHVGAIEALRQADEQGDAEAAVLLGQALQKTQQSEAAREAFQRGEARGHPEAAMCLGNLLSDLGDMAGARNAYERGIAAGSTMAVLNLGLMLASEGKTDEALRYLRRAADNGDPEAHWAIGKLLEDRQDLAGAASSYRAGADEGDAQAAYGLGAVLFKVGQPEEAAEAFRRAEALGHAGASRALEVIAQSASAAAGPDAADLMAEVRALVTELGVQRHRLGRERIAGQLLVQEKEDRANVLRAAHAERHATFTKTCEEFHAVPDPQKSYACAVPPPPPEPDAWISREGSSAKSAALAPTQVSEFELEIQQARKSLIEADRKWFGGGSRQLGVDLLGRYYVRLQSLKGAVKRSKEELSQARSALDGRAREAAAAAQQALGSARGRADAAMAALPPVLQPWSSDTWSSWSLDDADPRLRAAYGGRLTPVPDSHLGENANFGSDVTVPWFIPLHQSWCFSYGSAGREKAHAFIRSLMVRQLASVAPGDLQFCIFDPVGLGQSAGVLLDLGEYDASLIGGKVWTAQQDLDARLTELTAHIELVIQKYLRTTYSTIDEFNDAAGEIAEPYRVLVLFDFPVGLSQESATRLKSIAENGPRCGVFTVIAAHSDAAPAYGVDPGQVVASISRVDLQKGFRENIDGYQLDLAFDHDALPDGIAAAKRVIDAVGRAAISRTESAVTFDKVFSLYSHVASRGLRSELGRAAVATRVDDPATWWQDDTTRGLFAPIGQKGARDVAILGLDSGDHAGALLVGRPGSGKSTLLHTYIAGLTTLYGPDELDLYLIDFKEGVEFKAYAEEGLPHGKVIAIESDREFGLSVLESLQAEISQRAEVLRATGGKQAGMQALREATGEKLPRVLLVFDEFQVLFSRNDKVGLDAAVHLESIIRQGRGFGVHVLLGSQSLAGLDALGAHVPQLLPVRVLLPAAEADARKVLGDANTAGDYLVAHGEGILNGAGGAAEANERFKGALLTEPERLARLQVLRRKADERGFSRRPMVFEGNALAPLADHDPRVFREELAASGTAPIRLRTGVAMSVGDVGDLLLARESGANALAVVRSGDRDDIAVDQAGGLAYGLLAAAIASAAMTSAVIDVIDFMPLDDGLDELLEPLLDVGRITLRRRRAFSDLVQAYAAEVSDRVEQDDARREARLLFLFGVHRARELDADLGSLDVDADLVERLEIVMRDGPDVGVHVWMWSDSVNGVSRRLTPRMMREVGWRIAGKMSGDDSDTFIGTSQAKDLRDSQLVIANDDRGTSTRVTAYAPPSRTWIASTLRAAPRESEED